MRSRATECLRTGWDNRFRVEKSLGSVGLVCFMLSVSLVMFFFPGTGSDVFEASWSGRKALCTKGAYVALPGECSDALEPGALGRYLGECFPCVSIWK